MQANTFLSKSLFIRGLQCHKSLYLHKYRPEVRDELSPELEALFQSGTNVGILAQQLFPGGVLVPYEGLSIAEQVQKTQEALSQGARTIYEASFSYKDLFIKADILHQGKNGWELYEVKNSTSVKDVYFNDVAVQYYVLTGAGLQIAKVYLLYINNQYVRQGEIEVERLFAAEDLTALAIEQQPFVAQEIAGMQAMLTGSMPDIDIGKHCTDPYDCDFSGFCWQHIPTQSIFDLRRRGVDKFELYRQGIVKLEDVPEELLPEHQRMQLEGTLRKKNYISKQPIREFLDALWFPLCFLDFETTYMVPVPMFDGTRPYQPVPFQYSLHVLEQGNAALQHHEYLAQAASDPRRQLIEKLLAEIPPGSCVLAYNMQYEAGILQSLQEWFPEYAGQIQAIIDSLRDLMLPFKNRDIYFWEMQGSYSLKAVLPALVPGLRYEGMEISDGQMASSAWMKTWEMPDADEINKTRKALLEYCRLDTLGMVKIVERMKELCK